MLSIPTVLPRSVPGGGAAFLDRCSRSNSLFSNKVLIKVDLPRPDSPGNSGEKGVGVSIPIKATATDLLVEEGILTDYHGGELESSPEGTQDDHARETSRNQHLFPITRRGATPPRRSHLTLRLCT